MNLPQVDPLHVVVYPGSRVLQLNRPESGNIMTDSLLNTIKDRLTLYSDLHTVSCVLMTSSSTEFFSKGLETKYLDDSESRKQLISKANDVSMTLKSLEKETISLVGGDIDSCVFGVLATAKFRVGTETTMLRMNDLLEGRLPLGGGIAYHLAKTSGDGVALARYLALSGRALTAHDLYELGLLTHIVQQDSPEDTLCVALGHTWANDDEFKAHQATQLHPTSVETMLNSMHVYMGEVDLETPEPEVVVREEDGSGDDSGDNLESDVRKEVAPEEEIPVEETFRTRKQIVVDAVKRFKAEKKGRRAGHQKKFQLSKKMKEEILEEIEAAEFYRQEAMRNKHKVRVPGELSLMDHSVWDRLLLIPSEVVEPDDFFRTEEARARAEDLEDVMEDISRCFSVDSAAECRRLVEEAALTAKGVRVGDWEQENWAKRALRHWDNVSPALAEEWFAFTKKVASSDTLEAAHALEQESA